MDSQEIPIKQAMVDHSTMRDLQALAHKIPASIAGMFFVTLKDGKVDRLRFDANGAIDAMNHLYARIGKQQRHVIHDDALSVIFRDEALSDIIHSEKPPMRRMDRSFGDIAHAAGDPRAAHRHYATIKPPLDYQGTHLLNSALSKVSASEQQLLKRVIGAIDSGLRGCFTADLVKQGEHVVVHSVAIAPNVAAQLVAEGVLANNVLSERPKTCSAVMRYHVNTMALDRDEFLKLASGLPRAGSMMLGAA